MLKLVRCELWKYKRNKVIPLLTMLAVLFPLALVIMTGSRIDGTQDCRALYNYYDYVFGSNIVYSFMLFLPCLIGSVGAVLFFAERDNDTFKNIRSIPITCGQLVLVKLAVLYLWAVFYAMLTTVSVTVFCAAVNYRAVYDFPFKLMVSILAGIMIVSFSLPAVVMVIYFNQNYVLSILLAFSYSILNWFFLILFAGHEMIVKFLPLITGLFWVSFILDYRKKALFGDYVSPVHMSDHLRVFVSLMIIFTLSVTLILRFYKKWSR